MADKLVPSADDTAVIRRFRDMGDTTWAEVVSTTAAAAAAGAAGYPPGATPVAASINVAASAINLSLPGVAGKTTYVTSFHVSGGGATGAAATGITLGGVVGGSHFYMQDVIAGANLASKPTDIYFNPPLPASAANTAITLALGSFGAGNTTMFANIQGFQL